MNYAARGRRGTLTATLFVGLFGLAGCYIDTQRFPGPMAARVDPLPPGTANLYPAGPEEVLVLRHADPVRVRPVGHATSFPMPFYDKQARVNAGSWVSSGPGGRLEVLWSDTASILLFGSSTGVVGSPSRGEPMFYIRQLERAQIRLTPGNRVDLLGGSVLEADSGPFLVEHPRQEIMRVHNRSKMPGRISYRDAVFELDPGQAVDLPLLDAGAEPFQPDPAFQTFEGGGAPVMVRGALEVVADPTGGQGIRLRAAGEHELRARGLRVRLEPGEEVLFRDLGTP